MSTQDYIDDEPLFRFVSEHTGDVIIRSSPSGRTLYVSPSCRRYGWEPDAVVGGPPEFFVHPDDLAKVRKNTADLLRGRPPMAGDDRRCRMRTATGDWIWVEGNPRVVRDARGAPIEIVNVYRDVTHQVEQETALARARRDAEAATAAKSQFLANMSHEIRTPLTAVIGFTNLLGARDDLHPEARRYVERIAGAGRGLLAVVNDILDFSRLEAGQLEIRPRPVDLAGECEESVQTFAAQAEAKGLGLHFACDGDIPAAVMLDGDRLRQVLLNLVGNAVKFTEAGRVDVTVACAGDELRVEVRDTGPGLTPAQRKKLFQRFSQVDGSSTRRHGGAGLGLAICRSLAEAMGGTVDVRSRRGYGCCFRLRLPAPRVEAPAAAGPEARLPDIAGIRVMVVDDNPANRELARALLVPMGVNVCDAPDAAAGLAHAAAAPLDVILMDLRMPGMSGDQALAELRARPGPNRDIPVLAFTATSDVEGRLEPELAGFDGVVRKPIDAMALYAALARVTDWAAAADQPALGQARG